MQFEIYEQFYLTTYINCRKSGGSMVDTPQLYHQLPLLPYRFRYVGFLLIILSFGAAYLYFWGGRPAFFEIPVFAIVTSYVETRWMVIAQTNALDEIAVVFGILGLLFVGFSREKQEKTGYNPLRVKAIFYSVYIAAGLWILVYLTIFGWPIIVISATIFILFLLTYIITFRFLLFKKNVEVSNTNQLNSLDKEK